MDQYTRRIVGFGVHGGDVDGGDFAGCLIRPSQATTCQSSFDGHTAAELDGDSISKRTGLNKFNWQNIATVYFERKSPRD